jgi:DNA-directed RNA polymerase subunit RPC12/RpoP
MPFIGELDGETVTPEEVDDGVRVQCPECGQEMTPRGTNDSGWTRHFRHVGSTKDGCSSSGDGESKQHQKMKAAAYSALLREFPDYSRCGLEVGLDVTETATLPDRRVADVLLEFDTTNVFYGEGIVIEIQYRNHGKDLFATTHDYLSLGYSVYWATASNFNNGALDFDTVATNFSEKENDAFATYHYNADEFSTELAASLRWEDPKSSCDHDWQEADVDGVSVEYDSCPRCGTNRLYDEKRARYLYDDSEMIGPAIGTDRSAGHTEGSSGCGNGRGHVWEPIGSGFQETYRCAYCSDRMVVVDEYGHGGREIIIPFEHSGSDVSDLVSDPSVCDHDWERYSGREMRDGDYKCAKCGLIDYTPY